MSLLYWEFNLSVYFYCLDIDFLHVFAYVHDRIVSGSVKREGNIDVEETQSERNISNLAVDRGSIY